MAGTDLFKITITGKAAHSSAPHLGIDAIAVSGAVIQNLQQCVSRMNDPQDPLVLTIGTIRGGTRFNIIPNQATMFVRISLLFGIYASISSQSSSDIVQDCVPSVSWRTWMTSQRSTRSMPSISFPSRHGAVWG